MSAIDSQLSDSLSTHVTATLPAHARAQPMGAAIQFESQSLSWFELEHQTRRLALWTKARCSEKSQIALCLPNSLTLAVFFVAGVRAGCEVQVFDSDWPQVVIDKLRDQLTPDLFIGVETVRDPFADIASIIDNVFDGETNTSIDKIELPEPAPDALFYTGFTSGSSGVPKGFRRNHASWLASFANDQFECPLEPGDTIIAPGALSHSLFMYALMRGLHAGVSVVICRRFAARNVAREIAKHQATILYSVPAHVGILIRQGSDFFKSIRRVFSSGAKWPEKWRQKFTSAFAEAELCEFYGASELSFVSIAKSTEDIPNNSVGRAFHGVGISIRDDAGVVLSSDKIGTVHVWSDMLFSGYAGQDDHRVIAGTSAMTVGDLGYLDERGYLYLVGRRDRMIVSSGKNIYPEEVEAVLAQIECVDAVAVVASDDEKRGQRLLALLNISGDSNPTRSDMIAHCKTSLPMYKVPTQYIVCSDWPRTRSGKTDYKALETMWQNNDPVFLK